MRKLRPLRAVSKPKHGQDRTNKGRYLQMACASRAIAVEPKWARLRMEQEYIKRK